MKKILFFFTLLAVFASCSMQNESGDRFVTPAGKEGEIIPIKHGSIQIRYDGMEIEVDPVCSYVEPLVEYIDKPKANIILITHSHLDHLDPYAIHVLKRTDDQTSVLVDRHSNKRLKNKGFVMKYGMEVKIGDHVKVLCVPAYNVTPSKKQAHPHGFGNGYIINLDGYRIYIAGDTEVIPEMSKFGKIDVAFLPCARRYSMNMKQVQQAVKILKPKVLYPYSWNETSVKDIQDSTKNLNTEVRIRNMK